MITIENFTIWVFIKFEAQIIEPIFNEPLGTRDLYLHYKYTYINSSVNAIYLFCFFSGEFLFVIAILVYAFSISIDRVIRREVAEDNPVKMKVDDTAVPMYTVTTTQTKLHSDDEEIAKCASSQSATAIRKSDVELSTAVQDAKNPEGKMKTPNAYTSRSGSPTCPQIGCTESVVEDKEEELLPLHPGKKKSVGALILEKTPLFVIVAIVVLLAIIIHALSRLYLNN